MRRRDHHLSHFLEWHLESRPALQPGGYRQSLRAQELWIEQLGLVARAVVGEHGNDRVSWPQFAGETDRAGDVDARRSSEAQALVLEQVENKRHRLRIGDLVGEIDRRAFEVLGDAALPD